jgi:hypothetical protein
MSNIMRQNTSRVLYIWGNFVWFRETVALSPSASTFSKSKNYTCLHINTQCQCNSRIASMYIKPVHTRRWILRATFQLLEPTLWIPLLIWHRDMTLHRYRNFLNTASTCLKTFDSCKSIPSTMLISRLINPSFSVMSSKNGGVIRDVPIDRPIASYWVHGSEKKPEGGILISVSFVRLDIPCPHQF